MKQRARVDDRTLFRLDFALRGHGAYVTPADLEALAALVESASRALGAPLLHFVAQHRENDSTRAASELVSER